MRSKRSLKQSQTWEITVESTVSTTIRTNSSTTNCGGWQKVPLAVAQTVWARRQRQWLLRSLVIRRQLHLRENGPRTLTPNTTVFIDEEIGQDSVLGSLPLVWGPCMSLMYGTWFRHEKLLPSVQSLSLIHPKRFRELTASPRGMNDSIQRVPFTRVYAFPSRVVRV